MKQKKCKYIFIKGALVNAGKCEVIRRVDATIYFDFVYKVRQAWFTFPTEGEAVREYARIMAQLIDPPAPGTP